MKRTTKTLLAAGMIAAAGSMALAGASYAERGGYRDGKEECRGFHGKKHQRADRHGGRTMMLVEEFDTNQDGKVTQAEIDEGRQGLVTKFDADQDRQLTLGEYEALWLDAMRDRMVDRFQHLDADGDAIVTIIEFQAPMATIVADKDRNDDGALGRDDGRRHKGDRHHDRDDDGDHDNDDDDKAGKNDD
ncbi:MAG: hypothetical protein GY791_00190 [Alphaproteobacteria bacterium]|nr:hypothetical protein [Alphaproteobacteria bacterium]